MTNHDRISYWLSGDRKTWTRALMTGVVVGAGASVIVAVATSIAMLANALQ